MSIKKLILISIGLLFFCCNQQKNNKKPEDNINLNEEEVKSEIKHLKKNDGNKGNKSDSSEKGFLYVSIGILYHNSGNLTILKKGTDTTFLFKDKSLTIRDKIYDIIEDESLYEENFIVNTYNPEYDLLIFNCNGIKEDNYEVIINDSLFYISALKENSLIKFKTPEEHVLEAYPYLFRKKDTPLRKEPNNNSAIIENYEDYTYISIEVKGDWLKVRDDKDCYIGEEPSKEDIVGWVKWREDGEIILDIRHRC